MNYLIRKLKLSLAKKRSLGTDLEAIDVVAVSEMDT